MIPFVNIHGRNVGFFLDHLLSALLDIIASPRSCGWCSLNKVSFISSLNSHLHPSPAAIIPGHPVPNHFPAVHTEPPHLVPCHLPDLISLPVTLVPCSCSLTVYSVAVLVMYSFTKGVCRVFWGWGAVGGAENRILSSTYWVNSSFQYQLRNHFL